MAMYRSIATFATGNIGEILASNPGVAPTTCSLVPDTGDETKSRLVSDNVQECEQINQNLVDDGKPAFWEPNPED